MKYESCIIFLAVGLLKDDWIDMIISKLHIKGFRNFIDEKINLANKTLIIGGNDTGKSNLLYALRILFDPSLSQRDLELGDNDYCIYSDTNLIEITAKLEQIDEDCINSALQGAIKDGTSFIQYRLKKGDEYEIFVGHDLDTLEKCNGRSYIKNLAIEYVGSARDLSTFLKKQQNNILDIALNQRQESDEEVDSASIDKIHTTLGELNDSIDSLHYVKDALNYVNEEMEEISIGNNGYTARLVAGNTDANKLLNNLHLSYLRDDSPLSLGGDGRRNQLYFATWIAEQKLPSEPERVVIFAIEEPEAHLHPHQQRRLAEYLSSVMEGQLLMTTHSPQIVERFENGQILRLSNGGNNQGGSRALGCNADINIALKGMGYRLDAISSEVFFSDGVLLVEGPSERILYTALAHQLNKDLDKLNISILSVDGVGFKPYIEVCTQLEIPYAVRTDNDIFKVKGKRSWYAAGIRRIADIAQSFIEDKSLQNLINCCKDSFTWQDEPVMPENNKRGLLKLISAFKKHGLYLSKCCDLEADLVSSPLATELMSFFEQLNPQETRKTMQQRKAENMFSFIASNPDLSSLIDDPLSEPLKYLIDIVERPQK